MRLPEFDWVSGWVMTSRRISHLGVRLAVDSPLRDSPGRDFPVGGFRRGDSTTSLFYTQKRMQVFMQSTYYCLPKFSNIKFHENPFNGSAVITCGQTDRHGEANIHIFATFTCECA
jgi:hypothetical protein